MEMEEETSEDSKIEKHGNDGNSKGSFIYRVGKKIVITGAVISSAPFVLPPLLVASTLGFAFAVPFGLVYASYACTNKVMSKLLSRPEVEMIEQGEEEGGELERDEEEFQEDMKKRLEMRLDLIEDESGTREVDAEEGNKLGDGGARVFEELVDDTDGMVEGNGVYDHYVEEDEKLEEEAQGDKGVVVGYPKEDGLGGGNIVMDEMAEPKGDFNDKEEEELVDDGNRDTEELEGNDANLSEEAVGGTNVQQKERLVREVNEFMGDENVEEREIPVADTFDSVQDEEELSKMTEAGEEGYRYDENVDKAGDEQEMKGETVLDSIEPMKEEETVEQVKRPEEETSDNIEAREVNEFVGDENVVEREIPVADTFDGLKDEEQPSKLMEAGEEGYRYDNKDVDKAGDEQDVKEETVLDSIEPMKEEETVEKVKRPEEETSDNIDVDKKLMRTDDGEEAILEYGMNKSLENEEMPKEVTGERVEENRNEVNAEIPVEKVEANGGVEEIVKERSNDTKLDEMGKEEKPLVIEVKEIVEDRRIPAIDDSMVEEETPIVEVKVVKVVSVKENAREIADESGLDLFDEQSATSAHYDSEIDEGEVSVVTELHTISLSSEVDFEPQHVISEPSSAIKEPMLDTMRDESVDSSLHPDSSERMESADSSIQLVPSEVVVGPVDSAAVVEINIPSKEVLYTEEKIWELMDAMRKIVGYKGAKQPDISEELKALYMFTGVEPPVGFKDPLDIVEVNDKLRLLMAIIGVK